MTNPSSPATHTPPPEAVLMQMLYGAHIVQSLKLVAELGIADLLKGQPKTAAELAAETGMHAPSLYRLLRALAGLGVFAETAEGAFGLTPLAELLRSDVPHSLRDIAIFMGAEWHERSLAYLNHSVKTGETAVKQAYGIEVFDYFAQNAEAGDLFNRAMTGLSRMAVGAVVAAYDFSGIEQLVDIAGGQGLLLAGILQANPQMRGVLFDLPAVVATAGELFEQAGVRDRVEFASGDFFQSVPAGADAYLMKHIIHDWDDERCVTILRNIATAMRPGGRILTIELVVAPGNAPDFAKLQDLEMLIGPGGKERTADEYRDLLAAAGLRLSRIVPTQSPLSIIEAVQ